ncbi:MAG: hypothetical protein ACYS17_07410, partial [Planctomycetota bacterium]
PGKDDEGIRDANDLERIQQGVEAFKKYAKLLLQDGAERVFIATHIYKKSKEPQIYNERFALDAFMKLGWSNVEQGPDVWTPTEALFPDGFYPDQAHPNSLGAAVMAQKWFEGLCAFDDIPVPEWSSKEMQEAIDRGPDPEEEKQWRERRQRQREKKRREKVESH